MQRKIVIDGYSESLWKSLLVKSVRLGWPNGIEQAEQRLAKSTVQSLLICSIFEDIFPSPNELKTVVGEVKTGDYVALCARETHHGQGLTEAFCDMEEEAVLAAKTKQAEMWIIVKEHFGGLWLPPRSLNCFWTWWQLVGKSILNGGQNVMADSGKRSLDQTRFVGIPMVMADSHTLEGRQRRKPITILSGHYRQHRNLGEIVQAHGWEAVRAVVHKDSVLPVYGQMRIVA